MRAARERGERHDTELLAADAAQRPVRDRDRDLRALDAQHPRLALRPAPHGEVTEVPGLPLIRAVASSDDSPAIDLPFDRGDQVAGPDPGLRRRRARVDAGHQQAAAVLHHRHADAGELAADRLLEDLVLARGEVVREAVVERVDHAPQRAVLEPLVGDLAGVVVLDQVERARLHVGALVHEHVAQRLRQPVGMAAQVQAGRQRRQGGHDRARAFAPRATA